MLISVLVINMQRLQRLLQHKQILIIPPTRSNTRSNHASHIFRILQAQKLRVIRHSDVDEAALDSACDLMARQIWAPRICVAGSEVRGGKRVEGRVLDAVLHAFIDISHRITPQPSPVTERKGTRVFVVVDDWRARWV